MEELLMSSNPNVTKKQAPTESLIGALTALGDKFQPARPDASNVQNPRHRPRKRTQAKRKAKDTMQASSHQSAR